MLLIVAGSILLLGGKAMEIRATFHTDPGHGWLEVPRNLVRRLGVKVSSYSYVRGSSAYLEEDSDAPKFLSAAKANGYLFAIAQKHTDADSPIRSYDRF
jgi:hypothetical protein